MSEPAQEEAFREAVGVFHDAAALEGAVDQLLSSGFNRADLSLLADEAAVQDKLGHLYEKVTDAEDDPDAPRTAYVARESVGDAEGGAVGILVYVGAVAAAGGVIATGGTLAAAIVGAVAMGSVGGLVGASFAGLIGEHFAHRLQSQLDKGGLLLWVRTPTADMEGKAQAVLKQHGAEDVHIHDLSKAAKD